MGIIFTLLSSVRPSFFRRQVEYPDSLHDVCKENLRKLDESVVKHLRSLDTMQATADMLYRHLSISNEETDIESLNVGRDIRRCKATAARLLINIESIVVDKRQELVSSLRTFLTFIMFNGGELFKSDSIRQIELRIDEYESDPNVCQLTEDDYIKELQNENEDLYLKNDKYSIQVKTLQNECEELKSKFEEERHDSRKRIEHVQNENTKLKEKVSHIQKQNSELKQSKDSQAKQIKKLEADISEKEKKRTALHKEMANRQIEHTKGQTEKDSRINELQQEVQRDKAMVQSFEEKVKKKDTEIADLIREKEEKIAELKKQIQETIESSKKDKELQRNTFDNTLKQKERRNFELQQEMRTVSKTVESYIESINNNDRKIKELSSVVERKEVSLSELKQKFQKDLESIRKDRDTYENTLKEKERTLKELNTRVRHLEQQMKNKEHVIESYELNKLVMTEEKKNLCTKQDELSEQLNMKIEELSYVQEKVEQHKVEIQDLKRKLEGNELILQEVREEIDQKIFQMQLLQNECEEWKLKHETVLNKCKEMTAELNKINSIKSIPVQLLCQQNTPWTSDLESKLFEMLNTEMRSVDKKIELNIFKTSRPSDVRPEIPLLLLCVTISRLGTDVINATQGLTLTSNMAVIVFHHKDEHALPNQASERVLMGKEMKGSGGIFDMAFKSDKGIYPCHMNKQTIESLVTFLRRQII